MFKEKSISQSIQTKQKDYFAHIQDMYGIGLTKNLALSLFISYCSGAVERSIQEQLTIIGTMTIGGSISTLDNLADHLQVCLNAGAKKVLIPNSAASKISTVPPELLSKFQLSFYEDPTDAVHKALEFN